MWYYELMKHGFIIKVVGLLYTLLWSMCYEHVGVTTKLWWLYYEADCIDWACTCGFIFYETHFFMNYSNICGMKHVVTMY